jgi:peptide/nickel transport system permease protein
MLIPVLLGISLFVVLLLSITPGDPARTMLGSNATEERVLELREELGLNKPVLVRYGDFLWGVVHGDFGMSYMTKRPVVTEMMQRFPYTLTLVVFSLILSLGIGLPLGMYAATQQYTWKDNVTIFASLFCVSMPGFWFALLLIRFFGVTLRVLPTAGIETWQGWILPCISMAVGYTAIIARQTRSNMLEVIRQDYITTARAKGLSERTVLYRHALKNALIPVIMVVGSIFGMSLGGALITEVIFSIPGLGQYTLTGLNNRDYPVIQGSVLILSMLFAIVILVVDVIFALVDPRIRSQYGGKEKRKTVKQNEKESQEIPAV